MPRRLKHIVKSQTSSLVAPEKSLPLLVCPRRLALSTDVNPSSYRAIKSGVRSFPALSGLNIVRHTAMRLLPLYYVLRPSNLSAELKRARPPLGGLVLISNYSCPGWLLRIIIAVTYKLQLITIPLHGHGVHIKKGRAVSGPSISQFKK